MKSIIAAGALLFVTVQATIAATETHAVNYAYTLAVNGDNYPRLTFPGFDDLGGQRTLTRVDVRVQADLSASLSIENMNTTPLSGWTLEGQHLVLTGFEREKPQSFGPFAFLGGVFLDPFTATLAPNDGTPGSGGDFFTGTVSGNIDSTLDMDPSYLDFFNGGGAVLAVVGPFTEFFLDGATQYDPFSNTGDAVVQWTDLVQTGSLSVIYEYTVVPEPSVGLASIIPMLLLARRAGVSRRGTRS